MKDAAGNPLIGVAIQVEGETIGTVTDLDGRFTLLNIPPNSTILVTYVGMQSQRIDSVSYTHLDVYKRQPMRICHFHQDSSME